MGIGSSSRLEGRPRFFKARDISRECFALMLVVAGGPPVNAGACGSMSLVLQITLVLDHDGRPPRFRKVDPDWCSCSVLG
jgi:hypothetical protein